MKQPDMKNLTVRAATSYEKEKGICFGCGGELVKSHKDRNGVVIKDTDDLIIEANTNKFCSFECKESRD